MAGIEVKNNNGNFIIKSNVSNYFLYSDGVISASSGYYGTDFYGSLGDLTDCLLFIRPLTDNITVTTSQFTWDGILFISCSQSTLVEYKIYKKMAGNYAGVSGIYGIRTKNTYNQITFESSAKIPSIVYARSIPELSLTTSEQVIHPSFGKRLFIMVSWIGLVYWASGTNSMYEDIYSSRPNGAISFQRVYQYNSYKAPANVDMRAINVNYIMTEED